LRGIARVNGVSWSWLQNYVNNKLAAVSRQVKVSEKSKGKLVIECIDNHVRAIWYFIHDYNAQTENHQPVIIKGSQHDAIVVSKEDWSAIQETIYLNSIEFKAKIKQGIIEIPLIFNSRRANSLNELPLAN
jgi:hypothetical protein